MKVKIGQIMLAQQDNVMVNKTTGQRIVIPKGSEMFVGADCRGHLVGQGVAPKLPSDFRLIGYDSRGIALFLFQTLNEKYPMRNLLEKSGYSVDGFIEDLEKSIQKLGMFQ